MDMSVQQWINRKPRLSNEIYESVKHIFEFKVDMHFVYIREHKDPNQTWTTFPFIAIDDAIDTFLDTWPLAWCRPEAVGCNEAAIPRQKDESKHVAQQKWNEQHAAEARAAREAVQTSTGKAPVGGAASTRDKSSQKVPTEMVAEETPSATMGALLK